MPNMTLSIPEEIHEAMKKHKEIRWSEIARNSIMEHVKKLEIMDKITSKSRLTMKDVMEIDKKIKSSMAKELRLKWIMNIIIDSNVIMSALIKDSITRKIILESKNNFFYPKIALRNLEKYKTELIEKSNIDEYEFNEVLKDLLGKISLIEDADFLVKLD